MAQGWDSHFRWPFGGSPKRVAENEREAGTGDSGSKLPAPELDATVATIRSAEGNTEELSNSFFVKQSSRERDHFHLNGTEVAQLSFNETSLPKNETSITEHSQNKASAMGQCRSRFNPPSIWNLSLSHHDSLPESPNIPSKPFPEEANNHQEHGPAEDARTEDKQAEDEDAELAALLSPVYPQLIKLGQATAKSMPPYSLQMKAKSHLRVVRDRLLPIGKHIIETTRDLPDGPNIEIGLW